MMQESSQSCEKDGKDAGKKHPVKRAGPADRCQGRPEVTNPSQIDKVSADKRADRAADISKRGDRVATNHNRGKRRYDRWDESRGDDPDSPHRARHEPDQHRHDSDRDQCTQPDAIMHHEVAGEGRRNEGPADVDRNGRSACMHDRRNPA